MIVIMRDQTKGMIEKIMIDDIQIETEKLITIESLTSQNGLDQAAAILTIIAMHPHQYMAAII